MHPDTAYLRPEGLAEALGIAASGDFRVAAGCTDLFPATERKRLAGRILDITCIPELRGVSRVAGGLRIGAATSWTDIRRADLSPAFEGLRLAAREVGAKQIQNRGTIGGNLCHASPAADGIPPLLTLDAELELSSETGVRRIALSEFIVGPRRTVLRGDEILTAVHIPASALRGTSSFLKLGARRYLVISIAMVAARIELVDGVVRNAALAVGACGPIAARLPAIEARLIGQPLDPALIDAADVSTALSPIDDVRADAAYRTHAATELLRRAIACLAGAREAA